MIKTRHFLVLLIGIVCSNPALSANKVDVQFENDGLTISGTLNLPDGDGPFPAAVLIHGSGPNDRHQTIILNDPNAKCLYPELFGDTIVVFDDLATALTDAGMAVYQYEKRSREHAMTLDQTTVTPYDFINDAVAAAQMLTKRPDIKADKIIFIGHSQGANFVHVAAQRLGNVPAVVMLAGPALPIDQVIVKQVDSILRKCLSEEMATKQTQQMSDAFDKLRKGEFPATTPLMGAMPQFWNDWLKITDGAIQTVESSDVPTLIMGGLDDLNVPAENLEAFSKVNNPKVKVMSFEGINHMLTAKGQKRVDQKLLDSMVEWLRSVEAID